MGVKSNQIHLTRLYDAPVKLVWDAWTDPKKAAKWWGPRGFTITTHGKDLRPGGFWKYTMHGLDGVDYPNRTVYHQVEQYSLLEYDHGGTEDTPPLFHVRVVFVEEKGKTKMDMTMTFENEERAKEIGKFIKMAGGNSTWDRLGEYLEHESTGKEQFIINRSFNVPIALMYEMWSDPKHFSKWLPPTGFEMTFVKSDIAPGKSTFYYMTDGNITMYGRANYIEMIKPHRLTYTQEFRDEKNEKTTRHPFAPIWPEAMLTTVALTEEGPNQTRVTVTWEAAGNFTKEELEVFVEAKGGMTQGWTGSFDKLEELLIKM